MRNILFLLLVVFATLLPSCKTSEANYRAAYERTIAARDSAAADENETAIYGRGRMLSANTIVVGTDTIECITQRVVVSENAGSADIHGKFNVVVGQFKQSFNAMSMRSRLVTAGYEQAIVVQNGEPYYYVILSSHTERQDAINALKAIPADFPIRMRSPLPYLLYTP